MPHYKDRAQLRVYRFLISRQRRHQARKEAGTSVLEYLRRRGRRLFSKGSVRDNALSSRATMTEPGSTRNNNSGVDDEGNVGQAGQAPTRGSRRQKLVGYLRAANDIRQSYQQSVPWTSRETDVEELPAIPGAFPDVAIATHGDEQLVLFPSYCKRHSKEESNSQPPSEPRYRDRGGQDEGSGDAEFWKREWEKHENDKAIVDVDVRGWLCTSSYTITKNLLTLYQILPIVVP